MTGIPRITDARDLAQMIDISSVKIDSTDLKIKQMVEAACKYHCYLVTVLPAQTQLTKDLLQEYEGSPKLGGNVGFPSGADTTFVKTKTVKELLSIGVDEIDMVINVAALLSDRISDVYEDIVGVIAAAEGQPVKVILECHYLSDDQIRTGCDLAIKAGADFVKTGTGWAPTGATLKNITLIKRHVGDAIKIKASGGIREIDNLLALYRLGANRFGISNASAVKILDQLEKLPEPVNLDMPIGENG